jgi:hypothetical protein
MEDFCDAQNLPFSLAITRQDLKPSSKLDLPTSPRVSAADSHDRTYEEACNVP